MFKNSPLNIFSTLVHLMFLSSVIWVFLVEFKLIYLGLFLINFIWFGLSSSLYFHRTLSHKSAELHPILEYFFLTGAAISLSGSPISWVAIHRYHHVHPDTETDPHSPVHGRFWAYLGWVAHIDLEILEELNKTYAKDLLAKPMYRIFDHKLMLILPFLIYNLLLFIFLGLGGIVWGSLLATLFSYNFHWMLIASFCHESKFGYRRFSTPDKSRNIPWLSLLTFGESLHNNHHKYPSNFQLKSAKNEFDFSYVCIRFFEQIGLAKNIKKTDYEITKPHVKSAELK